MERQSFLVKAVVFLLFFILLFYVLTSARDFFVPIFLGMLFAFLLFPAADRLERLGLPRILVNVILILFLLGIIAGAISLLSQLARGFVQDLPEIQVKIAENIVQFQTWIALNLGIPPEKQLQWWHESTGRFLDQSHQFLQTVFSATTNTIFMIAIMPVYIFLFLYYRSKFHDFVLKLVKDHNQKRASRILEKISDVTPKYLRGLFIVVALLAVINSVGFMIIGVDQPIFFGILAAAINIIPVLGTIFGYLIVLLFVLATQNVNIAMLVVIQFIIVQFTENNILTPNITGSQVSINPMVIIISIIVGGMLWGLAGMFVIVPILGMLKIIFENVEDLQPYAFLMGTKGTEKHSITFGGLKTKIGRWFKKK